MTNKRYMRYLYGMIILVIIGVVCFSYFNAKNSAETLVGHSNQYFQLTKVSAGTSYLGQEKLDVHPYSKKGILNRFGEVQGHRNSQQ